MNRQKSRLMRVTSGVYAAFIFLFLYAPIAVLIALSFNESKLRSSWGGFSLKWYASLFQNDRIISALGTTLLLALLSAAIATVIGTAAAIGLHNLRGPFRSVLLNLTYIPMLNPDIVTGVAMLLLFTFVGYSMGFSSLLLSHIAFNIPYVVMSVLPKLKQMNPNLLDAAMDLGMKPATAITKVVVPEVMPGVVTGFLLAITMSIDDFVISFFTTGPGAVSYTHLIGRGARLPAQQDSRIVFNAGTKTNLAQHLHIVSRALLNALGLQQLPVFLKILHPLGQLPLDFPD